MIKKLIIRFCRADCGAVTVDRVVLVAAVATLGSATACDMQAKVVTKVYATEL